MKQEKAVGGKDIEILNSMERIRDLDFSFRASKARHFQIFYE